MSKLTFILTLSAVIYLRSGNAYAVVEGATPAAFDSHRVFGDGVSIGNTLMENPPPNLQVNSLLLSDSSASLTNIPDDAVPQAVYLWWSGNLALGQGMSSIDRDALFVAADGASQNVQADQCRFINASFEGTPSLGFYYCRADVTAFVTAHPGNFSYNGTYTVGDVIADPGRVSSTNPLQCAASEQGLCQAKYAAWSMVFIYDSPTATLQRDVILYDGFVHMDETNSSLGIVNFNIGGFEVGTPPAAEITYFGLEGDQQLGAGPGGHCDNCPDFFKVNDVGLFDGFNPVGNVYNSSTALGVDLDQFNIGTTGGGLGILNTGATSAAISTGSGDSIINGTGQTGESIFLGYVFLRLNRPSPNFRGSATTKLADPPSAGTGETVFYSVNVANQGSLAATGVRLDDALPAGMTYQPGSLRIDGVACTDANDGDACTVNGNNLQVSLGNLPAVGNNHRLVSFRGTLTATGVGAQVCNVGTITSNETPTPAEVGPACTTVKTTTLGQPSKNDVDLTGGVTGPDDVVQYTITIPGDPSTNVSGVTFEDDIPANVQLLGFTSPGGTAVDESSFTGGANGNGRVRFTNVSIPAGGSATVTVTVQVDSLAEFAASGISADQIHGRQICNQGEVSAAFLPGALPTNDPATGAAQDPTCFTLTFAPILSGSSKSVVDDNGGLTEPGDGLTYTISLVNSGNRAATIDLTDSLPPGVEGFQLLTPIVGSTFQPAPAGANGTGLFSASGVSVPAGATVTIRFRVNVRADAADGLVIQNRAAIVVAERAEENRTLVSPPLTVTARPVLTGFTKAVSDVNGAPAQPGDTLAYTLAVTNTGNRPATSVVITDVVPAQLTGVVVTSGGGSFDASTRTITWSAASLAVGATLSVSFTAVIVTPTANGTVISNQASIDSAEPPPAEPSDDPSTATVNDPTRVTVVSAADLSGTTKTVTDLNGGFFEPGDVVEYAITVSNTGTATATAVVLRDPVDAALTSVVPQDGGTVAGGVVTWNLGDVAPGVVRTVRFRATLRTPLLNGLVVSNQGTLTSPQLPTAGVSTDDPTTAAIDDPTRFTVVSSADFSTSTIAFVDVNGGLAQPGDRIDYTISLRNTGNSPATTVVTTVPADLAYATITPQDGGVFDATTRTITWTLPGPLAPGAAAVTLRFSGNLRAGLANGTNVCEAATIDSVQSSPFTTASACFVVQSQPDLSPSTKTVVDANGGTVRPGDLLTYTIAVVNQGAAPATGVIVSDVVDANLTSVVPGQGGVFNAGTRTITWTLTSVAAGATANVTFAARVVTPLDDGTQIANQGSLNCVGCTQAVLTDDPATAAPDDPTVVVVGATPVFSVRKTVLDANGGTVAPGDVLTYTIVVENTGDSCADNVVVVDPIDANLGSVVAQQGGSFDASTRTVTWRPATTGALVRLCPGAANAATLSLSATVATPLPSGTAVCDQARVTSDELTTPSLSDDPGTGAANDPTCVSVVSSADLSDATKTVVDVNGAPARPGDTLAYSIAFSNTGNAVATDVLVRDPIDPSLTNVVPGPGGSLVGGEVRWTLAQVAPGTTVNLSFTASIVAPLDNGTIVANQASISAGGGLAAAVLTDDPTTAAVDDPTLITVTSAADVVATKTVLDENGGVIAPGDTFTYTITLSNRGDANARNVAVRDVLDANLDLVEVLDGGSFDATTRTLSWNVASVAAALPPPGAPVVLRFRASAKSGLPVGTVIANQATFSFDGAPATQVSDDPTTAAPNDPTIIVIAAAPVLTDSTKTVSGTLAGRVVTPGTVVTYELRAVNSGAIPATGVVITDAVDLAHLDQVTPQDGGVLDGTTGVIRWTLAAPLAPGAFAAVHFTTRVRADVPDQLTIDNQGLVASAEVPTGVPTDDPDDPAVDDPTEIVTHVTLGAVLELEKTVTDVNGGVVRPGDELAYTITLTNSGTVAAAAAALLDVLPAQTAYVPGSTTVDGAAVPDVTGGPGSPLMQPPGLALGAVAPAASRTIGFHVRVSTTAVAGTIISNQAQAQDGAGHVSLSDDPSTAAVGDATQVIVGGGALLTATTKTFDARPVGDDGDGLFEAGEIIQFRVQLQNSGDGVAHGVRFTDPLPASATYVPGSLALDGVTLTDGADGDAGEVVNGSLTVHPGDLAAHALSEIRFQMRIASGVTEVTNQGEVDSDDTSPELTDADGNDANGDQPTVVPVGGAAGVHVEKSVQDVNGGVVAAGDVLLYTVSARNDGPTPVTDLHLTDALPAFTTYVAGSTIWPGSPPDPFVAAPAPHLDMPGLALAPGESVTITFRATLATGAGAPAPGELVCNKAGFTAGTASGESAPACVTIGQIAGTSSLHGRVYVEAGVKDHVFEADKDEPLADVQLVLFTDDAPGAHPVAGVTSAADGLYHFDNLPPGVYSLRAISAHGAQWARQTGVTVSASDSADHDVLVDPSGRTYNASTGELVPGVQVSLRYDTDDAQEPDALVPADRLAPGQQGQVTGKDGIYRFDVLPGRKYRLEVDTSGTSWSFPSQITPPHDGFAPAGPVVAEIRPSADPSAPRVWYQRFDVKAAGDDVTNNHVPLDPITSQIHLDKRVDRPDATLGDIVTYTITVQNRSPRDLTAAAGQALFVADAPARGLTYLPGHAVAQVQSGTSVRRLDARSGGFQDGAQGGASDGRQMRFGPFDVPAGATLTIVYQVVVGVDTREGIYPNRAVAVDAAGNELSNDDTVKLRVKNDPIFDEGLLVGRVVCDTDGDGRAGPRDRGVMGARVYIDTGSYAVTDSTGRWHLSSIDPGVHLVKIDRDTLPGGSTIAEERESQILYFTRGFVTRVDFPVTCGQTRSVTTTDAEGSIKLSSKTLRRLPVPPRPPKTSTTIAGDLGTMALYVDGKPTSMPAAELSLVLDPTLELPRAAGADGAPAGGMNLVPPPNGNGWQAPHAQPVFRGRFEATAPATAWTLAIRRVEKSGELTLVRTLRGQGAPGDIVWDGTDEDGKSVGHDVVLVAQLRVRAQGDVEASSPRVAFGIGFGLPLATETLETLHGDFFAGTAKAWRVKPPLTRQLGALAKRVGPEDTVIIEVHADGTGDRLKRLAETQKQAEAVREALARLLALPPAQLDRVKARGRGSLDPIAGTKTAKDRAQNRRVVVRIIPPAPHVAGALVPDAPPGPADALVLGEAATLDESGRFVRNVPTPADGRILVDAQAADGRRASTWIVVAPPGGSVAAPPPEAEGPRLRKVEGDVASGSVSIDGAPLDASLLWLAQVDVGLEGAAPGSEPNFRILPPARARKLKGKAIPALPARLEKPLRFELTVPPGATPSRWSLVVSAEGAPDAAIYRKDGNGMPPPITEWSGADDSGKLLLQKAGRYQYKLYLDDARGDRGESPQRTFTVAATRVGGFATVVVPGKAFVGKNEPGARLKNQLARLAAAIPRRPAGETYEIEIVAVQGKSEAATDTRLAAAAQKTHVQAYLAKLKLPAERVAVTTTIVASDAPPPRPKAGVTIRALPPPVAAPPRALVGGEPATLEGTTFHVDANVPKGGALLIDVVRPSGQRALWVLPAEAAGAKAAPPPGGDSLNPYENDNLAAPAGKPVADSGAGGDALLPPADARLERGPTGTLTLAGGVGGTGNDDSFGAEELDATLGEPDALAPPETAAGATHETTKIITLTGSKQKLRVPADVLAAELTVDLPPRGLELASPDLWLSGRTHPRNKVKLNGREITLHADGSFDELITLPAGDSTLVVESIDPDGDVAQIAWPVRVADSQHFLLVLADGAVSSAYSGGGWTTDGAELDGMTDETTVKAGHVLFHGRVALYYKGRIKGGDFFKRYDVTAHVDTATRAGFEEFFQSTLDPTRDYAVYGDSATEVRDAQARGKLYLLVKADESSAIVGNFKTDVKGGELFRYDRTVYGAAVDFKKTFAETGAVHLKQEAKVFASSGDDRLARDVNVFRATGGSLYYLRHGSLVEGSEKVRLIVRDRDNGLVLSERVLGRDTDYVIDASGGRIMFKAPIASTADSSFAIGNLDSSTTPLQGHPVYVEVSYEYQPDASSGGAAAGVYVRDTIFDTLAIGAGVLGEGRTADGGLGDYTLAGADVAWTPGKRTTLRAELARSTATDADNYISMDGGLSFQGLNAIGLSTSDGGTGGHVAWKLEVDSTLGDFAHAEWADHLRVRAYAQDLDRGFYSGGTILEQGRQKYGVLATYALTALDTLTFRHDADVASLPRIGPTPSTVMGNPTPLGFDERESHLTTLQWARVEKKLGYKVELSEQSLRTTATLADGTDQVRTDRWGVGGQVSYKVSRKLTLRAGQEFQFASSDRDPVLMPVDGANADDASRRLSEPLAGIATSVGADWELAPDLHIGGTLALRWNGDSAAQIGLKTPVGDDSSMYVTERAEDRDGRLVSTSIVGAENRFGAAGGGKAYGEYQLESGVSGVQNRAVLGIGHRWSVAKGWNIAAGFEHQQTFGGSLPDGTPTGKGSRDVVHLGSEVLRADTWKASTSVELRFDEGAAGSLDPRYTDLIKQDPRPDVPPGTFPDHGGTAPGAPVVFPAGKRLQVVATLAGDWKWSEDLTFLGRFRLAHTQQLADDAAATSSVTLARFVEATAGWAYRPLTIDWLDLLFRYSYLLDQRPLGTEGESIDNRSHVLALAPIISLPLDLKLSGKLAWKRTESRSELLAQQELSAHTDALLALARLSWGFIGKWDVALEYRVLRLGRDDFGSETRQGVLAEIDYNVSRFVRLGVGWNFTHFADDELGELDRDTNGFFFRVVGRF